jgi:predicted Zn-dependent protease
MTLRSSLAAASLLLPSLALPGCAGGATPDAAATPSAAPAASTSSKAAPAAPAATAAPAAAAAQPTNEEDVVFRAMKDELDRSMKRLRLEEKAPPFYIAYTISEERSATASASFGALTSKGTNRSRSLETDVRVGDYAMDSRNFGDSFDVFALLGISGFGGGGSTVVDDDYDALRNALWQATDGAYKEAVEKLEEKKAWLQANEVKDRPEDFSRETPVTSVYPMANLEVDAEAWAAVVKGVSAAFREYPSIQQSHVVFLARSHNRWFRNSEGFRNRRGAVECGVVILAGAQAADGMRLADYEVFTARDPKDLPGADVLAKSARTVADRLTKLAAAPPAEEYRGPVIFEGAAAADFLSQAMPTHLGHAHVTLGGDNPMAAMTGNQWKEKVGQKVVAPFLTLVSDPAADDYRGTALLGGWKVDDDGVPAQKVTLIEKGVLKTFCHARIPSRELKNSNGHSRGGSGTPGTLFLTSDNRLGAKELRARAFELAKEEGLTHVVVIRRLGNLLTGALTPSSMASTFMGAFMGGGGIPLLPPVVAVKVSIADGSETPLRGASFGSATLRLLRDIDATGDDDAAWPIVRTPENVNFIVTPSLLVKEMELKKPGKEAEKLPVLPNPWFEAKEGK